MLKELKQMQRRLERARTEFDRVKAAYDDKTPMAYYEEDPDMEAELNRAYLEIVVASALFEKNAVIYVKELLKDD